MPVKIAIAQIHLDLGQKVRLDQISWQEFERILEDLGEHRHSHIAYYRGVLEIGMPLPEHERAKVLIGDFLKIILDELGLEWESLGSTTFKNHKMLAGIEPDDCFYIKNCAAIVGKKRLDLNIDPVPDLAIEVDLTSQTKISAYESLAIPEIWRIKNNQLEINLFRDGKYIYSATSESLPFIPVTVGISQFLENSKNAPMSSIRKEFRLWVQKQCGI